HFRQKKHKLFYSTLEMEIYNHSFRVNHSFCAGFPQLRPLIKQILNIAKPLTMTTKSFLISDILNCESAAAAVFDDAARLTPSEDIDDLSSSEFIKLRVCETDLSY
ncbi:conserved hypothetical protein, partial [Trichinella spiralis]|uniref:hypothetical protein n=1 Tax=Trichinella spiralis TaxID=6334 RepID=UPI0001EFEB5F